MMKGFPQTMLRHGLKAAGLYKKFPLGTPVRTELFHHPTPTYLQTERHAQVCGRSKNTFIIPSECVLVKL